MNQPLPRRTVTVPAERLSRWVTGFADNHGEAVVGTLDPSTSALTLVAPDGAQAVLRLPFPLVDLPAVGTTSRTLAEAVADLARQVLSTRTVGVVLVRRGGFAAAVVEHGDLRSHRVGTRYVQGRTAAGGWSQQRFARRRRKQADELVGASVRLVADVLGPWSTRLDTLATGGDRPLVDQVLSAPPLAFLEALPRRSPLAVADPRGAVVKTLPTLLSQVRIDLCP